MGFSLDNLNLDDPKKLALMSAAFGLLAPHPRGTSTVNQLGDAGLLGLQSYAAGKQQQQQNEVQDRANRASDLQQLSGAYSMLKQQEFGKMLAAKQSGQPHSPNPMLPQMEAKLSGLMGLNNMSGPGAQAGAASPPQPLQPGPRPQLAPPPPPQPMPPPQGAQMSTPQNPQFSVPPPRPPMPPQPQQDQSGLGGPAGGLPMEAWLAMDPTGAKYMEQIAKDNAPIPLRQGDLVGRVNGKMISLFQQPQMDKGILPQRDSNGQVTSAAPIPGYIPALSGIKSAETSATEGAKFPFSMIETADGRHVPAFMAGIQGPGASPAPAAQNSPQVAKLNVTQPPQAAPSAQPSDPWTSMPKRSVPQGVGLSAFDGTMQKNQADTASKLVDKYGAAAEAANNRIALNNQALNLVDKADTGPMAAQIGDVKNWLVSRFGVPESSFANTPSATISLQKDLLNAATQRAKQQFGSRITQSEVMLMLSRGSPNVDMTKESIKYLIGSDNAMSQYAIQQSNDLGHYLQQSGDPSQFEGWHARAFPASHALGEVRLGGAAAGPSGVRRYNPVSGKIE